jgi:ribosomal protein S18 acetylase RimI-like enzyme
MIDYDVVIGYGMLRGWDEGYSIPFLGISIHPSHHGKGYGKIMMNHLHRIAYDCGVRSIKLKVYKDNIGAISLYKKLGYILTEDKDSDKLVGTINF